MIYGILTLIFSMVLAVIIRIKSDNKSCIVNKVLPFIIVFIGGILATFFVLVSRWIDNKSTEYTYKILFI